MLTSSCLVSCVLTVVMRGVGFVCEVKMCLVVVKYLPTCSDTCVCSWYALSGV